MTPHLAALLILAACGSRAATVDSGVQPPTSIAIRGYATIHGAAQPPADGVVQVGAYRLSDHSIVAETTVAGGQFALAIPTTSNYGAIYLQAASESYVATYFNFPAVLVSDYDGATLDLFTPTAYAGLYTAAAVTPTTGTGVVEAFARSYDGFPQAGSTFLIDGAATGVVVYDGSNNQPDPNASSTAGDGIGFVLNASAGSLSLSSFGDGGDNDSRQIAVVPDAVAMMFVDAPPGGD